MTAPIHVLLDLGRCRAATQSMPRVGSVDGMAEVQQLSQAAFDRLAAEHRDLTTRGRIDIARKIESARELGDLSENGDYHAAKEEQGRMEGRILHLAHILDYAEIVVGGKDSETVRTGTTVTVLHHGEHETQKYLVGSIEEQSSDVTVVSPRSPMGAALLGASVKDVVTFNTPTGATMKVVVVAIE